MIMGCVGNKPGFLDFAAIEATLCFRSSGFPCYEITRDSAGRPGSSGMLHILQHRMLKNGKVPGSGTQLSS